MRTVILLLVPAALASCKSVECGEGTIERNGACEPADQNVDPAMCGPNTVLQGDKCVPTLPPTKCDPSTTTDDVDPVTGIHTCIGTGGGGCSSPFACPNPSGG